MMQDAFNIILAQLAELKVSILHNQQPVYINILPIKRKCSITYRAEFSMSQKDHQIPSVASSSDFI